MSLLLTIVSAPASVSLAESSKTFDVQGGTIGRGKDNAWVLEDPERFLSSLHCQVTGENGQYFLTDLSTNGTFLNGSPEPMGKGCKLPLNDGDKFTLGDYEFSVSLWNPSQFSASSSSPSSDDIFAEPAGDAGAASEPAMSQGSDPFFSGSVGGGGFEPEPIPDSSGLFSGGIVSDSDSLFNVAREETDPLAALDKAQGGSPSFGSSDFSDPFSSPASQPDPFSTPVSSDPFSGPTHSDQADALNQQVSWPEAAPEARGGVIPDDWDDDLLSPGGGNVAPEPEVNDVPPPPPVATATEQPVRPVPGQRRPVEPPPPPQETADVIDAMEPTEEPMRHVQDVVPMQQQALEKANAKIEEELRILKEQIQAQKKNVTQEVTVDTSLVDAMGFQGMSLTDEQITEINEKAGEVIRESVKGLMQVLSSRSSIKNEFRMNVTTIQPVENNPLKFSANVDDALENMFVKQGNAYKKPVEAVKEGFDGIAEHQVAIIAGIRAAFRGVIERFDPVILEERFAKQSKGSLIPGMQKAKNWELYTEYFNDVVGDIDTSFQYLFGDEFVQAYEDQLRKLAVARKKSKPEQGNN